MKIKLYCICISKVTKFKANNNNCLISQAEVHCICISKVTKFKANNNQIKNLIVESWTVFA